jgi:putative ABC transport system permease protein
VISHADQLLARANWRHLLRYPWQLALAIAGVAIGVAAVVAVDVATTAAERAFQLSVEAVSGHATDRITGPSQGLDDTLYRRLRLGLGMRASAPLVEGYVEVRGETLRLLGVDPFAEAPIRDYVASDAYVPVERFITEPGVVLLAKATSDRLKLKPGEQFFLSTGGSRKNVRLLDYLQPGQQPAAAIDGLMIADIGTAQVLLGKIGRLSAIDLQLPEGRHGEWWRTRIKHWLPPGVQLGRIEARTAAMAQMTRAFDTNLTAMSWLTLLVGMFLIYSTMTLSVLRRRSLLANLRALGVTRAQVFRLVLVEALIISVIAVLLGLPVGILLGQGLTRMVTRTINDLYFTLIVREIFIGSMTLIKGAALGVGATLLAALGPVLEAAGASPRMAQTRSVLEGRVRRLAVRLALIGGALMLLSAVLLLPGRSLVLGFAALFTLVVGYAFMVPSAVIAITQFVSRPLTSMFGIQGVLAARGVEAGLSRTGVAAAALVVAVAATVGVTIMIQSFRNAVATWLESNLQADIYVTASGAVDDMTEPGLAPVLIQRIEHTEGVAAVVTSQWVEIGSGVNRTQLHVIGPAPQAQQGVLFKQDLPSTSRAFTNDQAVLVSEPYAYRHAVELGDTLRLVTDHGTRRFKVAGIFYDYASSQGVVMMRRGLYERFWHDRSISSLGVYLSPHASTQFMLDRLRAEARHTLIRSNHRLRDQSLAIFDRTFAITQVLRLLALLIAAVGILSSLMALLLERGREFAVLRATGFTPGQIGWLATGETGLLGLIAGLLAAPLGITMSLALIEVINRRSFGWSMPIMITPEPILHALLLATAAALLAGLYPAWKQANARPAEALRSE